jgi:hypothetical protein
MTCSVIDYPAISEIWAVISALSSENMSVVEIRESLKM